MLEIDGARYSGSGAIVRQGVAFAALTGQPVRIVNIRARRPRPGLRHQHVRVVEAVREIVNGACEGVRPGATEIFFRPGKASFSRRYSWDIGSAGSTTALALALLPVIVLASEPVEIELQGGVFQDFAPSFYHLKFVMLPLLQRIGIEADLEMVRPGYVPRGQGILRLSVKPGAGMLHPLVMESAGSPARLWGVALSSHLAERKVSDRMAEAAQKIFSRAGYEAEFETVYEDKAAQPGAAFAAFADLTSGARLGQDMAGAPNRRSEAIGREVARRLLEDVRSEATLDRYASDQIIPFASLAAGESRFAISGLTDHVQSGAWLSRMFLGTEVRIEARMLVIRGVGLERPS